jgi:hypothetical protein
LGRGPAKTSLELTPYDFITNITTATVSYSHRWRGYADRPFKKKKAEPPLTTNATHLDDATPKR